MMCVGGWDGGDQRGMSIVKLVFPTFTRKVIFLIFKELVLLKKDDKLVRVG